MTLINFEVGNEMIRGVSGGERKRTSIGMELITSPDVLFLDEPTTGLDAATAVSVMQILHKYDSSSFFHFLLLPSGWLLGDVLFSFTLLYLFNSSLCLG